MSLSSEERTSELRKIFFESAQELVQALNEYGLKLEQHPADTELIRDIRRTVHTLKGDSAACGFKQLSQLAHELEDALAPDVAARPGAAVAQVVFSAADIFDAMLAALQTDQPAPDGAPLRELIHGLASSASIPEAPHVPGDGTRDLPKTASGSGSAGALEKAAAFSWNAEEYQAIRRGAAGKPIFNIAVEIDPQCAMREAAVHLVRNVLGEAGTVLVFHADPRPSSPEQILEAAIASERDAEWILRKCRIPAVAANVVVHPLPVSVLQSPFSGLQTGDSPPEPKDSSLSSAHIAPENLLRVDAGRVEAVLNLLGELIISRSMLNQAILEFGRRFPKDPLRLRFTDTLAHQSQILTELQRSVMKIRMVRVEQLFRRFPRMVRDLGKALGKEVALQTSGEDTDLDKAILDSLAEPLAHLVRNAVDHGIETPEERARAGKPRQGCVRLNAYHHANQIVIEVSDDGRGIDPQQVAAAARQRGLLAEDELGRLTDTERLQLIFVPGFSTNAEVTQVSGRGVGLDVVKSALERLKGTVSVRTRSGEGATFQLRVPLTLAIAKALLFRVGQRLYALPLTAVQEIARCKEQDVHHVEQHEALSLRGEIVTVVRLGCLGLQPAGSATQPADEGAGLKRSSASTASGRAAGTRKGKNLFLIVVSVGGSKFGLVVDQLIGEEELVIKALDGELIATELVSGASILGDGTVVLILNLAAVLQKTVSHASFPVLRSPEINHGERGMENGKRLSMEANA